MERIGEPWVAGRPYRDRIGVYGLITGPGGLLCVIQRAEVDGAPIEELQLPGGGLEPGEPPVAALHRELIEETGWAISTPRRVGAFQSFTWLWDYRYWARKVHLVYRARVTLRRGPPREPGHMPLFLPPEIAAEALDVPGDREMVRRALAAGLLE